MYQGSLMNQKKKFKWHGFKLILSTRMPPKYNDCMAINVLKIHNLLKYLALNYYLPKPKYVILRKYFKVS